MWRKDILCVTPAPAIGLAALAWLMSLAYGFQYMVMGDRAAHLSYFRVATVPFAIVVVLLTTYALSRVRFCAPQRWPAWLGFAMMSVSWVLCAYFHSEVLGRAGAIGVALGGPAIAALCQRRWGEAGGVAAFVAAALALFVWLFALIPHDGRGDMLQIIDFAATDLLRGESPFRPYFTVSGMEVPFGYWPGVWLPYVPLVALGMDMRVLNLGLLLLMVLLFWRTAGGGQVAARILAVVLFPFILSPPLVQMVVSGHLWLYWFLVCAAVVLLVRGRHLAAAAVFGLCLATRPTVLFIAAPLFGWVWARVGWRMALAGGGIALAVLVLCKLPFYLIYGEAFVRNSYGALVGFGQVLTHFSLTGILQGFGLGGVGKLGQVLVALAAFAVVLRHRVLAPDRFVVLVGLCYVWEVLFASYATRYLYFPGFFLIALGLVMAAAEARSAAQP